MDGNAYMDGVIWLAMLERLGFNPSQLRDNRYDCVIHLVTAADGAEQYILYFIVLKKLYLKFLFKD